FKFDLMLNTVAYEVDVSFALSRRNDRDGTVLLETISEDLWMLRSAVCSASSVTSARDVYTLVRQLATHNRARRWGYLIEDAGSVWFVVAVAKTGSDAWRLLSRLADQCGRLALYYRSVLEVRANVATPYRSRTAFPSVSKLGANGEVRVEPALSD